jgi:metal-responsive CopG/Arc/MetJ family transcriptional regulator
MAKVMISLPDSLLERIDAHARARRTSRSAFLRGAAERALATDDTARGARIRTLLENPGHHGGDSARLVREMRDAR